MMRYVVVAALCGLVVMACSDDGDAPPTDAGREVEEVLVVDGGETDDSDAEDEEVSDPVANSFDEEGNPVLGAPGDCHERGISYGDECVRLEQDHCRENISAYCGNAVDWRIYAICDDNGEVVSAGLCPEDTECQSDPFSDGILCWSFSGTIRP